MRSDAVAQAVKAAKAKAPASVRQTAGAANTQKKRVFAEAKAGLAGAGWPPEPAPPTELSQERMRAWTAERFFVCLEGALRDQ